MLASPVVVNTPPDNVTLSVISPTNNVVRLPSEVIFGCAAVVTLPAYAAMLARATVPVTSAPVRLVSAAPLPIKWSPCTLP